jgi:hypothetical protein
MSISTSAHLRGLPRLVHIRRSRSAWLGTKARVVIPLCLDGQGIEQDLDAFASQPVANCGQIFFRPCPNSAISAWHAIEPHLGNLLRR